MFVKKVLYAAATQQAARRLADAFLIAIAALALTVSATAATVVVSGTTESAITAAISSACNGSATGTVVFPDNTYSINSGTGVTVPSNCTLQAQNQGQAVLNAASDYAIYLAGNNVTITGLVLNGGGILTTQGSLSTPQTNVTITHNTIQNISNGNSGIDSNGYWKNFNISYNHFTNISNFPWANITSSIVCEGSSSGRGLGINQLNGMDQSIINHNLFDHIMCDGMHIGFNWTLGLTPGLYTNANNNEMSYNVFHDHHRMAIELQAVVSGCPGGCNYGAAYARMAGMKVNGNYSYHQNHPYYDQMGFSLVPDHAPVQKLNNTMIFGDGPDGCNGQGSYAFEDTGDDALIQGNVLSGSSTCTSMPGWPAYIVTGSTGAGTVITHQNNMFCGKLQPGHNWMEYEGTQYGTAVNRYNYMAASCPNAVAPETSQLSLAFSSANNQVFPSGGNGTWSVYVTNELSIVNVQFFIDGSSTPVVTQELQDLNANFANDRKWLYHATINTSQLTSGAHTISAVASDVSGAVQTVSQSFQVGNSTPVIPAVSIAPASLQFGSQQLNTSASPLIITVTNTGTATLNFKQIQVIGANASDFSDSSACGAILPVAASCTLTVTFRPSAPGTRSAVLSITDDAVGSTQSVPLSGSGIAVLPPPPPQPPSTPGTLPTNLPKGMVLWLANDAGLVTSGKSVSAWEDQSGNGNSALQANPENQPSVVPGNNGERALHFDGTSGFMSLASLPIDGSTAMSVFLVSSNGKDQSGGYGSYALLYWPETESWGSTFFGSYQTSSHFRFGTTQTGNEPVISMPFTRTNSFGLSEWIHDGTTDSMWLNGQSVASFANRQQQLNGIGTSALLGKGGNNTYYSGDVSEVIVYTRALTATEQHAVEQYLMKKYHL